MRPLPNHMPVLPERSSPLGLELSFPLSCLASIQLGYESQGQDDKWSIYFRRPWIQIWRPSLSGLYCYAVRLEQTANQRLHVAESWVGYQVLNPEWFGSDLERHREIVTWLLDGVTGYSGDHFKHRLVAGTRCRKKVMFNGEATSLDEVEEISEKLRAEVAQMVKDGW